MNNSSGTGITLIILGGIGVIYGSLTNQDTATVWLMIIAGVLFCILGELEDTRK